MLHLHKPILNREMDTTVGREPAYYERDMRVLYDPDLGVGGGEESEVREILCCWRKPCPRLREVKVCPNWVWTLRAGVWGRESVEEREADADADGGEGGGPAGMGEGGFKRVVTERMERDLGMIA